MRVDRTGGTEYCHAAVPPVPGNLDEEHRDMKVIVLRIEVLISKFSSGGINVLSQHEFFSVASFFGNDSVNAIFVAAVTIWFQHEERMGLVAHIAAVNTSAESLGPEVWLANFDSDY
ncbi:hypothetical protein LQL77_31715 [Rhodococcus cerastii]|nr:hypothetical protein [Rhodococcus cerastii]